MLAVTVNGSVAGVGRIIKQLRKERGWERARLAREASVDARSLYNVETGKTQGMRSELLDRVAKALGTTADEMKRVAGESQAACPVELPADLVEWCEQHAKAEGKAVCDWIAKELRRCRKMREKAKRTGGVADESTFNEADDFGDQGAKPPTPQIAPAGGKGGKPRRVPSPEKRETQHAPEASIARSV